jgi:hypothetical protein
MSEINFGSIGLKIGDLITITGNGQEFIVASEGGGTLIRYYDDEPRTPFLQLFSLRRMTRMLINDEIDHVPDIFELWQHEGRSLRNIFQQNQFFLKSLCLNYNSEPQ